jgi:neutral trehalase
VEAKRGLGDRDAVLLDRASRTLVENVVLPGPGPPPPWHPRPGIRPSPGIDCGIWNWDAAFHAIAAARWDPGLAFEQAYIFTDSQNPDGSFVDVLYANGTVNRAFSKPPVFPWAGMLVHRRTGDDAFVRRVYGPFKRMTEFWEKARGGDADGLFHYGGAKPELESGWDNSVRWDAFAGAMEDLWPVDLNCYLVMLYRAMQYLAKVAGEPGDVGGYAEKERALAGGIERRLWHAGIGRYADTTRDGSPSPVLSPAVFMPLFTGVASRERAGAMAAVAADPKRMYPGLPTVSYDHPSYEGGGYWRGPAWLNTTYFTVEGLRSYGHRNLADRLRETILGWCADSTDSLHEYYDSRTGTGCGAPHFGWTSAFLIEMIQSSG